MRPVGQSERVLTAARKEIGTRENPPGSNKVKYNTWFYGREVSGASYPWCCVFVCWVFAQAGVAELVRRTGGCTTLMNWFKARGRLVPVREVRPGDIVFYQFDKDAYADHVGIVEQVSKNGVTAIEGNTSVTSNDNGGAVMRRSRGWGCILAAARPAYAEKEEEEVDEERVRTLIREALEGQREKRYQTEEELPPWAREDIGSLVKLGVLRGDETGKLELSGDMVRMLAAMGRLGRRLREEGEGA